MKTMFGVKTLGISSRIKALTVLMLCAIWAMVWTFVQVGQQAEHSQARLADVGEQMVLSQRVAKYALAASAGDVDAFGKMESFKNEFKKITWVLTPVIIDRSKNFKEVHVADDNKK